MRRLFVRIADFHVRGCVGTRSRSYNSAIALTPSNEKSVRSGVTSKACARGAHQLREFIAPDERTNDRRHHTTRVFEKAPAVALLAAKNRRATLETAAPPSDSPTREPNCRRATTTAPTPLTTANRVRGYRFAVDRG
ncbi:unnamed protein product, partial [Allacma fusca]